MFFFFIFLFIFSIFAIFCLNIIRREKKTNFFPFFFFFHIFYLSICVVKNKTNDFFFFFFFFLDLNIYFLCLLGFCSNDNTSSFFSLKYIYIRVYFCFYKSLVSFFVSLFFCSNTRHIALFVFVSRLVLRMCTRKVNLLFHLRVFFFFCKRCALYSINAFESRNNRDDYYSVLFVLFEYMSMYVLDICRIKLNV
jgi:hypothetical protein